MTAASHLMTGRIPGGPEWASHDVGHLSRIPNTRPAAHRYLLPGTDCNRPLRHGRR